MAKIKKIIAREILDSRGVPTIETKLILDNNRYVISSVPSGESLGKYEGVELRDQDPQRYLGFGVQKAVSYINQLIGPKLAGVTLGKQADVDYWLIKADGTENRQRLGVNTVMAISQLILKANALDQEAPLYQYVNQLYNTMFKKQLKIEKIPGPIFNVINGGKHGTKNLEFQEFQIIPSTGLSFSSALQLGVEIYSSVKNVLEYRNVGISVSEEGGFTPSLLTNTDALEILKESIVQKKLRLGVDIFFGIDFASSHYYKNGKYLIKDKSQALKIDEYIQFLIDLNNQYNILILEDPLEQEDFAGWKNLNDKLASNVYNTYVIGDDFLAGNKSRIIQAIKEKACSGILLKLNQVSTVTEIMEIVNLAKEANFKIIFSHRLGETNDTFIADFAVGIQTHFVKFGSPARGERVAKYNRLLEIEELIKTKT